MTRQRGFALLAVLLVMAVLGVVGAEFAYSMRLEAASVRAYKGTLVGSHLAEAGVEQAVREIMGNVGFVAACKDAPLTFVTREAKPLPRLERDGTPLGAGRFAYTITDEEGRLNLNTSAPARVDRLLEAIGLDKIDRDPIVDSLQDWKDADEDHRLNGAESEDTYLLLPVPYRSKNTNLDSVNELLQIKGVTPAIFNGGDGKIGLAGLVTVKTPGTVNINTAPAPVLTALGFSDAEISDIEQGRCDAAYQQVPARFGGRGLAATTRTFRIEARGIVDGQVRARVTAIVQKTTGAEGIAVLEWSGIR